MAINADHVDEGIREILGRLKPGLSLAMAWAFVNLFGWLGGLLVLSLTLMAFGVLEDKNRIPNASLQTLLAFGVAGALLGISVGVPQWLVLRPWFDRAQLLIPVYILFSAICVAFAATSVGVAILVILLLPVGLGIGLWAIVRRQLVHAGWWSTFNAVAPFAGIMMAPANRPMTESVQQPANLATLSHFFLLMLLPTAVSGLLLVWLMRRSQMKKR